jgi:alanyl-tRNA synthetase
MSNDLSPEFLAQKTFDLYQTHGVPIEVSEEILQKNNLMFDRVRLDELIEGHQKQSQTIASGVFKAGLSIDTPKTRALHTTTHLLHMVLKTTFGNQANQIGSSINEEKARFDISLDNNLFTQEKINQIVSEINHLIQQNLKMSVITTSQKEAREMGAIGLFGEKYNDEVTVYLLKDSDGKTISKEFCSGPHVDSTSEIKEFVILKKKSIGSGQTRIEFDVILN